MPRLVTVQAVRNRLLIPDIDRVNDALCEILDGISLQLEAELRTTFLHATGLVDLFYCDDSLLEGSRFHEKFLLSRGLVDESVTAVKVELAATKEDFLDADDGNENSVLILTDPTEAGVDHAGQFVEVVADRGVVLIQDFRLLRSYLRITYDAGIEVDSDRTAIYKQSGTNSVPARLKELASLMGMLDLSTTDAVATLRNQSGEGTAGDRRRLGDRFERRIGVLLDQLERYEPEARKVL